MSASSQIRPRPLKTLPAAALILITLSGSAIRTVSSQTPGGRAPIKKASTSTASAVNELKRAVDLLQAGKRDEAESVIRQLLVISPRNPDAHSLLGIVLDQKGKTAEAEREYRTALRLNPAGVSALANLGVLLARTNRAQEAIKTFEAVLRAVPDHPQATLNLGLQYSARGDDARAIPLLKRAIAIGLDGYDVQYRLGVSLYKQKQLSEAQAALESAASLQPESADTYYYLGLIAWSNHEDDRAADLWDRARTLRPDFAEVNFMLGEVLRKNQRALASIEFYQRALDNDTSTFVYYARLGGVFFLLGQHDRALEIFQRAAQRFPRLAEAHYFIAIAARARGDFVLAEAELMRSLALKPNDVDTLAQLGFIVGERNRLREAENLLRRAIAINDKHFYASYDLGRVLMKSKRYEDALVPLSHAARLKPAKPNVHYQLFIALSRLKRTAEANRELTTFKQLEEVLKARPRGEMDLENEDIENPAPPPD